MSTCTWFDSPTKGHVVHDGGVVRQALTTVLLCAVVLAPVQAAAHPSWPDYRRRALREAGVQRPAEILTEDTLRLVEARALTRHSRALKSARARWEAIDERWRARQAARPAPATGVWYALAECESDGDWGENAGTIYDGGLQFHPNTWLGYGGGEFASEAWMATPAQQITIAQRVLAKEGPGAWPRCSYDIGMR